MIILELMRRTPKPSYAAVPALDSEVKVIESKPKTVNTKSVKKPAKKTTTKKTTKTK
jgi:hypothetical protein